MKAIEQLKDNVKNNIKSKSKRIIMKIILPYVGGALLVLILIAGSFFIIEGKIKDAAGTVVKAASKITSIFDNKSDTPTVVISDELIEEIKKEMENDAIDQDATYLTDALLKASLQAYYATQYPYIDSVEYDDDDESVSNIVKGCIYLKRGNEDMHYVNYDTFSSMIGDGKGRNDKDKAENSFSVDNEGNIVIATWNMTNVVTETINDNNTYDQEGSQSSTTYSISEYKIDQKSMTQQYAMSYKFPILLANMFSNEGFGIAVAKLGRDSKIELSVLDSTTQTTTVSREFLKANYKASGTYNWRDLESDPIKTENFADYEWEKDYTSESNAYKVTTENSETNQVEIKMTSVNTWNTKGDITDVTSNSTTNTSSNTTNMEDDSDYKEDATETLTEDMVNNIKNKIIETKEAGKGPMMVNSIETVDAKVYKKTTNHSVKTDTTTTETSYTSSDMELTDNTDKFLALIKANSNGEYDENGELVEYIVKGAKVLDTSSAVSWSENTITSNGKYIVKTDESGALPTLTKKQLKKACNCLSGEQKENALKFIDAVKDAEDKYKVNAVFSLAVFRKENGIASNQSGLLGKGTYNIGSISGRYNNQYVIVTHSNVKTQEFRKYPNYDEAIVDYARNIAEGTIYFKDGRYDVDKIGEKYCVPPDNWIKIVKEYIDDFYKAAGVSTVAENSSNNSEAGSSNSENGDGYSKTYTVNGKTNKEFKQTSGTYYNVHYSGGNIATSGCGPTSAAIVASGYGKNYNPGTLVEAARKKYHVSNFTASPAATGKMLKTAGLNYTETFSLSKEQFKNHLKSGRPVVMSVDNSCGGLFTNHTHYIAILDINKKGDKVYVANPSKKASGWIDIDKVIKCNSSSARVAFLITSK